MKIWPLMRARSPRKVILLLGNYRPTLALARTYAQKNYQVIVGSHGYEGLCGYSSAVSEIWEHPDPDVQPQDFICALERLVDEMADLEAIFPVAENYVRFFCDRERQSINGVPLIMVDPLCAAQCLDKERLLETAVGASVPTAEYAVTGSSGTCRQSMNQLGLPIVIRALDSDALLAGKKAVTIENERSQAEFLRSPALSRRRLLLQKQVQGLRHNVYFSAFKGEMIRHLHAVITRTDRIDGSGLATEGHTQATDPRLPDYTARLIRALGYSGIGCAQYLVDARTGTVSFLEINPRIAGNHALPESAGLELGQFMLDLGLGRTPDLTPMTGRGGIRYCWTSADLVAAKESYLRGDIGRRAALGWVWRALWSGLNSRVHMVFSWSDPVPGLMALWSAMPRINRWKPAPATPDNTLKTSNRIERVS